LNRRSRYTDYDEETTARCERALVTLLGDLGPWRQRVYLVGGLAPRYIVGRLPADARAHVGTTDVDLVVTLLLGTEEPEAYRTLKTNLEKSGFHQEEPSFRWSRSVDGATVLVEFICETDAVALGGIFRPKGESTGSGFTAFNVRGAQIVGQDFVEVDIESDRLDGGGRSRVTLRVANLVPFVVLKILAFQERHENKDAYDLVFTLLNSQGGPKAAGQASSRSPVASHRQVKDATQLLSERFAGVEQDGPTAYADFLAETGEEEERARLRLEAVVTIREFLAGFGEAE